MKTQRSSRLRGFSTRAIHEGYDPGSHHGSLNPPVYLNATYSFDSIAQGQSRFAGETPGYVYARVGNPTQAVLEQRLASLEGGEAALAVASGIGAITALIWSFVRSGDEIVADKTLYGCTFSFLGQGLSRFGVTVRFVDLTVLEELAAAITPATQFVFFETPTNPNMRVIDIAAVAKIAHDQGARVIVDNTYGTPWLQRPIELGADFVVHSMTKYLSGHGDLLAGAVIGLAEDLLAVRTVGLKDMTGAVLSAFDSFLLLRGIKTLELRMARHCDNALALARQLEGHPAVGSIYYPGLQSHPQFALASRQMTAFGGMIALELAGGYEAGVRFMDSVKLAQRAVSLGDAETLVQHPASMTHNNYTEEEREAHGISFGLVRISVGLENLEDLSADILQALDLAHNA
ncbi:MAG: methionine gamma-lyase [Arenicellales bacterium]|jgi:methionine gamma-lyase|nr:methionine gamma-lyase [Acidiferrobacteraceae bacterium]MDP6141284.1 methionine gamma-lyase [Arenicellales bacterium]HCV21189.1 methionine gamma-lyase [Gammaproteobacteria bacterium]MDP6312932.1 methionine gamma-lyase [Arenicellales bacterium]MDP7119227.1 methionine gamma-lyase [Arenicellales bacterium]